MCACVRAWVCVCVIKCKELLPHDIASYCFKHFVVMHVFVYVFVFVAIAMSQSLNHALSLQSLLMKLVL